MENKKELIDRKKVYELACAGCTRHGDTAEKLKENIIAKLLTPMIEQVREV